jgi:hypothetical protein
MAVRLEILADVKGQNEVDRLKTNLNKLGTSATIASKRLTSLEKAAVRGRASLQALATTLKVGVAAGFAAVTFGVSKFVRDTFEAGNLIQSLEIRFNLLFGSVSEGSKAFDELNKFAAKVPFSLEEIASASGNLAVISDDADELSKVLELTGNVAAATGLDFRQTAEQIQRAFAGGIASADVFRERGVRAMLGFQAGVTVSVEETRKRFFEVFGKGGEFGSATDQLATTLKGQVSLVQDAYFQFRKVVAEEFFDELTAQIRNLVGDFKKNGDELNRIARNVGQGLGKALKNIDKGVRFLVTNFDKLVIITKIFIGLKVAALISNIGAAALIAATNIKLATGAMLGLNNAIRLNPFGILITVVQGAVLSLTLFREETQKVIGAIDDLIRGQNSLNNRQKAAEQRLKVQEAITKSVQDAVKAQNEHNARIIKNAQNQRAFNETVRQAEDSYGALNDLLIIHEDRAKKILNFNHLANGIVKDKKALEEELEKLDKQKLIRAQNLFKQNKEFQEAINNEIQKRIDKQERLNLFLARQLNLKRQAFQESVRIAEAEFKAKKDAEAANNRESGMMAGRVPDISQEQIDAILNQQKAYESVLKTVDEIGKTVADNLFDAVKNGKNVFDALKQTGVDTINEIARNLLRSGISELLGRAVKGIAGGGSGGFLNTIFGGARNVIGFNQGGIVPGGAPYTDRVPAMLTPGEVVIPRNKTTGFGNTNITNINISGNVDQRSIDQIKSVIANSQAEVGSASTQYKQNTRGLRGRNR